MGYEKFILPSCRTSVRKSLQMHFKVAVWNFHVFNASKYLMSKQPCPYNHNTCTDNPQKRVGYEEFIFKFALRTSVRKSLQMHFKVAVWNFHVFNASKYLMSKQPCPYNHNTCTDNPQKRVGYEEFIFKFALRTSVRKSLQMHFKVAVMELSCF